MTKRLIGTGTTDATGKVSITYTGVGAGKLQITAEAAGLTSDTYELIDAITMDKGTSSNYNNIWLDNADTTLTRYAEYSEITEAGSSSALLRLGGNYNVSDIGTIEFDFQQVDGATSYSPCYIRSKTGGTNVGSFNLNNLGESVGTWTHIKIVFNGGIATVYSDAQTTGYSISLSTTYDSYSFAFSTPGSMTSLLFKNFVVY